MARTPEEIINELWNSIRIGTKISNGPRRTPSLELSGTLYPMYEADIPCPVCRSCAWDGRQCGAMRQCMEEGCGRLYNWHDFANRCEIHEEP